MKVIALSAQMNMGKDVLCDYLVQRLNEKSSHPWLRAAFANAVKDTFADAFGVDRAFIEAWKRNPEPPPGFLKPIRQSLQFIGDGFRQIKDEIWIDIALRDETKKLIISDSRYINEARAIRAKNGLNVVIYRPNFFNDDPNPSEAQIKPIVQWCVENIGTDGPINKCDTILPEISYYDYFIVNDGTLEDLYRKVDNFLIPYIEQKWTN